MADEYSNRINATVNSGCIAIVFGLAKDTGILDALKSAPKPVTSSEVAEQKKLKERYVREILGCLSAARFVHVSTNDRGERVFHLTEEEKAVLTEGTMGWAFLSATTFLASLYKKSMACVKADGPNGFLYGPEIQRFMEDFTIASADDYIKSILDNTPGLKEKLEAGVEVAEFGCGRGNLLAKLAERFPTSKFSFFEYTSDHIETLKSKWSHMTNVSFGQQDVYKLADDITEKFDMIILVDVVHDLPHPQVALRNLYNVVKKDGGVCALVEPAITETGNPEEVVGNETAAAFFALSTFACIPESYQVSDSEAMGCTSGKEALKVMASKAGFKVDRHMLSDDFMLLVCEK